MTSLFSTYLFSANSYLCVLLNTLPYLGTNIFPSTCNLCSTLKIRCCILHPSPGKRRWVDYCHVITILAMMMMMMMTVD